MQVHLYSLRMSHLPDISGMTANNQDIGTISRSSATTCHSGILGSNETQDIIEIIDSTESACRRPTAAGRFHA